MELVIKPQLSIKEIQQQFSELFPFLKLEFFTKKHSPLQGTEKKYSIDPSYQLNRLNKNLADTCISINDDVTVIELEQIFQEHLGLPVQVFRKSGNSWLETTFTDSWSLVKQNQTGANMSKEMTS